MKKNFTKPNRSAFTLIELIFVIVILGVLAATALPRFLAVGDDAKVSAELGTIGGVRTSLALSHSRWMMDNNGSNCNWDRDDQVNIFHRKVI
jgi:prepilin-type N-terminal cleavage/methylation domain-containing protein